MSRVGYEELIERCKKHIPTKLEEKERLEIPKPLVVVMRKHTIIKNFWAIIKIINRDPKHFAKFLFKSLAIPGFMDKKELHLHGKVSAPLVISRINEYMEKFVFCEECGKADTTMKKEGKVFIIKCEACGARRSVK